MTTQRPMSYDEALAELSRAVKRSPGDASAVASRGQIYRLMEGHDEALADFNRALRLAPGDAPARASRGQIYLLMGRHDEALEIINGRGYECGCAPAARSLG
jgi:tetratricopeptide (TPR) repeat protein